MHAYAIQDSAGLVKLDAMENPFRLSLPLQKELGERLGKVAINRYPCRLRRRRDRGAVEVRGVCRPAAS